MSGVAVAGVRVHFQFGQQLVAQLVLGQHAFDRIHDDALRMSGQHALVGDFRKAAAVSRMPVVGLLLVLAPGHFHLPGVDDDDVVTAVKERGEVRMVLAAQNMGNLGGQAAEHEIAGIDQPPLFLNAFFFRQKRDIAFVQFHFQPRWEGYNLSYFCLRVKIFPKKTARKTNFCPGKRRAKRENPAAARGFFRKYRSFPETRVDLNDKICYIMCE